MEGNGQPGAKAAQNLRVVRGVAIGCGSLIGLLIVAIVFFAVIGSGEPQTLKAASRNISKIESSGPNQWITLDLDKSWGKLYLASAATELHNIGRAIKRQVPGVDKNAQWLQVQITAPTIDRLGNEGRARILSIRFPMADLKAANYDNLDEFAFLNLADEAHVSGHIGDTIATEYCADQAYGNMSRAFCARLN